MKTSIIYRNVFLYRMVMNLLYSMKYKKRFIDIINLFSPTDKKVLELCFGDTMIAENCKKLKIEWIGFDINEYFVKNAKRQGYNASFADISELDSLPQADVCIMCGSLYHFNDEIESILLKMLNSSPKIIISEPIENLSSRKDIIGKIAGLLTNAGKGKEIFRFNKNSIIEMLDNFSSKLHFSYKVISSQRDILIEIQHDRNQYRNSGL